MVDIWSSPKPLCKPGRHVNHHRINNEQEFEKFYLQHDVLGKGSFGIVKQAEHIKSGLWYAVKTINKEKAGSATERLIEREVNIMKRVTHEHIICLEEVYEASKQIFLVMELCTKGSLEKLLKTVHSFSEKTTLSIIRQLIGAVSYLHDNDIVHRDLKLENILLSDPSEEGMELNIKITDFGLSYICGGVGSDFMMQQMCGTPTYMAPEVIKNFGYSKQCDIWSSGVIMYMLLTGETPFTASTEEKLFDMIKQGVFNQSSQEWAKISHAGQQLIKGMLEVDPAHRYTSKEVLHNHPWIQGESTANGVTTNVLKMMAEYDKEQKKGERQPSDSVDDSIPAKSVRRKSPAKTPQSSSTCLHGQSSSQTQILSHQQKTERNNRSAKNNSLPSYMQPTKSSLAVKKAHLK